ncbi:GDSL-type esterase/lipase family protein [Paenibacillus thailandensis]|uniref:GDSL-type esterase/lipase family protein n=1 Tax=Paenibacillus thailandensis TaxID=393250 RepID=A0ABW5QT56_9BACL
MRHKRSHSRSLWISIGAVSCCASLLLLYGFGYAAFTLLYPSHMTHSSPAATPAGKQREPVYALAGAHELRVTAIGDSLTKGTGDASGEGFVKQAIGKLQEETGKPVKLVNNLGIRGQRADQLAERIQTAGYRYAIKRANVIMLSIGGNDLFAAARESMKGNGSRDSAVSASIPDRLPEGLDGLGRVLKAIHELNPDAQVVYIGLYNPFYDVERLRAGSMRVTEWNAEAYRMLSQYENMQMIPVFDLFEGNIGSYLSSDHFHPNHEGYGRIAERIVQSLNAEGA